MFPITISFTVSTQAELDRLVAAATKTDNQATPPVKSDAQKPGNGAKPAATPSTAQGPAAPETKAENSAPESPAIDFATQIQKPIVALAAAGKRAVALELLQKLNATRASDIKPEDYPKAIELIAAAQAG